MRAHDGVGVSLGSGKGAELRERIIRRAALEFKDGMYGILSLKPTADIYMYNFYNRFSLSKTLICACHVIGLV